VHVADDASHQRAGEISAQAAQQKTVHDDSPYLSLDNDGLMTTPPTLG
jgi:hypothetical protein